MSNHSLNISRRDSRVWAIFCAGMLLLLAFWVSSACAADSSLEQARSVRLVCDYKNTTPSFFIKSGKEMKKADVGLDRINPAFNKFIGRKTINLAYVEYIYGYFLSTDEDSGKVLPDPIGTVYVRSSDVYCLDVDILF